MQNIQEQFLSGILHVYFQEFFAHVLIAMIHSHHSELGGSTTHVLYLFI